MLAQKGLFRVLLGVAMGIGGGFGLTMMIFPYGIIQLLGLIPFEVSHLPGLALPIVLMWALAGGLTGWYGSARLGGLIMGLFGAISGLNLALFLGGSGNWDFILAGLLVGLLYGMPLGIMLGIAFPNDVKAS